MQVAHAIGRFHRVPREDADAPWLCLQAFLENRGELLEPPGVPRLADQGKRQLTGLGKVAVIDLESFDRLEPAREKIEHLGVEAEFQDEHAKTDNRQQRDRDPDDPATLRDEAGNGIGERHAERRKPR